VTGVPADATSDNRNSTDITTQSTTFAQIVMVSKQGNPPTEVTSSWLLHYGMFFWSKIFFPLLKFWVTQNFTTIKTSWNTND
jgi:hypothetical protein